MNVLELCAGMGGTLLGLRLAGADPVLVGYAEVDQYASQVMAHHYAGVPNLGDVTRIRESDVRSLGHIDLVTAGFPCSPVSQAGLKKGIEDERWLITDICRVARWSGAPRLFLENVPGLFAANDGVAMGRVCSAMAQNGYRRWVWDTFTSKEVGAPHRRERWFCLATATDAGG